MYSFVIENKSNLDQAVTSTYMGILKNACVNTGENVQYITNGSPAKSKDEFIVTDTVTAALSYVLKGYHNHIIWMQGIIPEESYMRNQSKLRFFIMSFLEKMILKKAKMLLLVSKEMQTHYERKYKIKIDQKSIIMPCFNETEVTNSSFFEDKYTQNNFVYVGGLHSWQCFEQTVQLYKEIEKSTSAPTKFYVFTLQKEAALQLLNKYGIQNYEVDYVEKEDLSERIKYMKYGFVLREDCVVNNVATPTKLSNYLANGIIPIYSSALKSFENFDKKSRVGIVYDLDKPEEGKQRILSSMNEKILSDEFYKKCTDAFNSYYNANLYCREITVKLLQLKN